MSDQENLPTGNPEKFVGELEKMNLQSLKGKMFGVAIGTGARDKMKFLCSTLRAPLDFYQMVEMIGSIIEQQQLHAKAFVLSQELSKPMQFLDECTIDYIEANYMDIIADGLLDGSLDDGTPYTCRAGFLDPEDEDK